MATLTASGLTLVEVAKRHDPNGNTATIAEVLNETNEILNDVPWIEANDTFSNVSVRRSSLPNGTWRKLNAGVATEKTDTSQVRDTGILETESKNDIEVINAFADKAKARMDESRAFIEGLGQTMASTIIYGNTLTTPEQFMGAAPRLASLATTANVLNEGGTGSDLTSIFVVNWSPSTAFMTYPKGSKVGLQHDDMGVQIVTVDSKDFRAYVDFFTWKAGMVVKDPRSIGRVANIESAGAANIFDEDSLITLLNRMNIGPGARIYCNRTVMTQAQIRLKDKTNVYWSTEKGLSGEPWMRFNGIPVRRVDQILDTEAALT